MKVLFLILACLIGMQTLPAQTLIPCSEDVSYFALEKEGKHFFIKLEGKTTASEDARLIMHQNHVFQMLLAPAQQYEENGKEELRMLITYVLSEAKYFSNLFKREVQVAMEKLDLDKNKKAIFWHYDIPQDDDEKEEDDGKKVKETQKIVKQVSFSIILDNQILSVGATLSTNQSLDDLKKLLNKIANSAQFAKGKLNAKKMCKRK